MSIRKFIRKYAFDDQTAHLISQAFDAACAEVGNQSNTILEIIALRIIDAVKKGERDPELLRRAGLATWSL